MTKILLADESITIRKVVELVLSDEGFQVEAVATGDEAISAAAEVKPALILADVKAKGKNGYEIAQAIKGNPATTQIPVLLLAGAFEPVNEDLMKKSGADGSLIKPFEAKDLIDKVKTLVKAPAGAAAEAGGGEDIVFDMSGGEEEEVEAVEVAEAEGEEEMVFDLSGEETAEILAIEEPEEGAAGVLELGEEEAAEALEAVEAEGEALELAEAEGEDLWDLGEVEEVEATQAETVEEFTAVEAEPEAETIETIAEPVAAEVLTAEPAPAPAATAPGAEVSAETVAAVMPGREEMSEIFRQLAAERLDKLMGTIDLKSMLVESLAPTIKESLNKMLYEATPEITEKLLKDAVQESMSTLNEKLESVIWETVPELAETIIRKEIEKIKSEA